MKKLFSILLVVAMLVVAMATTAFAEENPGSITIKDAVAGKTYDLYKIFDLTYAGEGEELKVAYTIAEGWTDFFAGAGSGYIAASNNEAGTLNPIAIGNETKYMNITEENVTEFAQDALAYAAAKGATASITAENSADVTVSNLTLGYYLVYPQGATEIKDSYGSICSLTSTVPSAEVNIKATYPTITKTVDDQTVDFGQVVHYTIKGSVPDTTGYSAYTYQVTDTLSAGLTLHEALTVKIGGTEITLADNAVVFASNGFTLTLDMTQHQANKGEAITVEYEATVNKDAVIGSEGNPNKANLTYSNDPADATSTEKTPDMEIKVYTCAVTIDKYDMSDTTKATKLAKAKFILAKDVEEEGQTVRYYLVCDNTTKAVTWTTVEGDATEVITDENGAAEFKGIEKGTYYLIEVESPEGYNMLTDVVEIEVDHETQTENLYAVAQVGNRTGAELPETGGIGTKIFYIVGGALMLGAIVLLIAKKKSSRTED